MTSCFVKDGMLWLNYYVDGKRIRKSARLKDTPENKKLVEEKLIPKIDESIVSGEIYKKKSITFDHYGSIFLREKSKNKTFHLKSGYWLRAIDHFKGRNVDTITRLDVKRYLQGLDMLSKSKNAYKSCIKEIFELAIDDGVLNNNPAISIKLKQDVREDVQYYSREEVSTLLNAADGIMKPYLTIAFNTGMRAGEILGLHLSDFKEDGFIHIKRTRTKGMLGTGKTNNAIRKVPYSSYMLQVCKEFQSQKSLFIFGEVDDASRLRSQWSRLIRDTGLKKHKLYSTRHTFATLMLKENVVSINELAGLLGHSNPKITLEHYASVINSKDINLGANFELFSHDTVTVKKENA